MTEETLRCDVVAERGLVERYVAGRLHDGAERAAFEAHLLTCEACREEVRVGLTVRAELAASPRRRRVRAWLLVAAGLAMAAGVAALILLRDGGSGVRALGAVREPPAYLGVAVRATPSPVDSLFEEAMQAYTAGDYAGAGVGLERALAAGVDSAPALFFLGASRLLDGQASAAADPLRRVIGLGDTPYRPEAHYYLAKALLRQGKGEAALRELRAVPPADSAVAAAATALADSVARLRTR